MCGRFTYLYRWRELYRLLNLTAQPPQLELVPSYNVAPTQQAPVCRRLPAGEREIQTMSWGFVPGWAESGAKPLINTRCETAATSPVFRGAVARRRCVVPASGFYEWKQAPGGKTPFYFQLLNDPLFFFAAIWERRPDSAGAGDAFSILTTRPNELLASVHNRMPVILRREHLDAWLSDGPPATETFEPYPAEEMTAIPVSPRVNSPRNNDASLIQPDQPPPATLWG
jgi:putative SOS response-associated peptidase YedK